MSYPNGMSAEEYIRELEQLVCLGYECWGEVEYCCQCRLDECPNHHQTTLDTMHLCSRAILHSNFVYCAQNLGLTGHD